MTARDAAFAARENPVLGLLRHFQFYLSDPLRLRPPKDVDLRDTLHNEVGHRFVVHPPTGLFVQVPVDHRTDPPSPRDELLCKYKGSRCNNPRSLKRNGELHSLCEFHRERANANQGRFDTRLRQRRDQADLQPSETSDLPNPIRTSEDSPTPPLNEWEAELLLKTIEDSE